MNRRLFLALLAAMIGLQFGGCSSDSDGPASSVKIDKRIIGTWYRIAFHDIENDHWNYWVSNDDYYTFNADGSYTTNISSKKSGTYTFDGTTLVFDGGFGESVKFSENNTQVEWGKWRYQKK